MIKDFIKIKNKAIVTTDDNKVLVTNCHPNLEDELNLAKKVESIKSYIDFLEEKLQNNYDEITEKNDKVLFYLQIIASLLCFLIYTISAFIFGPLALQIGLIIIDIAYGIFSVREIKKSIRKEKSLKKEIAGINCELEYLEKVYNEAKTTLDEMLENNKKFEKVSSFYKNDSIEFKELKDYNETIKSKSQFYYDLGANAELYCEYFMNGTLREKLQETHSEENIQKIEEYFQKFLNNPMIINIGPILARKKNKIK